MPVLARAATLLVVLTLLLTACTSPSVQATIAPTATSAPVPTAAATVLPLPTASPPPTAIPTLADDVRIAGVDVGGMTPEAAREKLTVTLAPLLRPLDIQASGERLMLQPEDIDFAIPFDTMITQARAAQSGARIALAVDYNEAKLRSSLEKLAGQIVDQPAIAVITSTKTISRSFALSGGEMLDIDDALARIDERLHAVGGSRRVTLALAPSDAIRPTPEQLQEQIEAMAAGWKGVVGVYIYDINNDEVIASLNENTVFSAASTIKAAIMLNAYINIEEFSKKQERALEKMIVESDNLAANTLLAAAVGGGGTEEALAGAEKMSALLRKLGLKHTYLYVPFEATDYIKQNKIKFKLGPVKEGDPPYTNSGRALRTTPAEMARIYLWLDQCVRGAGPLLDFERLNKDRCQEMLDHLAENGDYDRMRAGLPEEVRVEHKSGWVPPEMQADVGIVRSDGGDFVVAIYLYQPGERYSDEVVQRSIGSFARLAYTYFNPVQAEALQ